MKIRTEQLPSLPELLRKQLDAVSSLRPWTKLRKRSKLKLISAYLKGERLSDEETSEAEPVADTIVAALLLSSFLKDKEGFIISDENFRQILGHEDPCSRRGYEEFYAYQFIDNLEDIARRAASVRHMFANTRPSATVVAMCREAYQTYIHGYHAASAALIRSLLEAQLKECLSVEVGTLGPLNDKAREEGLYGPPPQERRNQIWKKVRDINKRASSSVHEARTPSEEENLELVRLAQDVLQFLNRNKT